MPPFTTKALAESFDSTRKSTSALSSLNTAPPLADKAPVNVDAPVTSSVPVIAMSPSNVPPSALLTVSATLKTS